MRILIGCPTFDRRLDIGMFRTIMNIERQNKHSLDFIFPVSSHLSRNRNMCCLQALKDKHDAILFWDSDIEILDNDFLDKMIQTAFRLDAKIVGGLYKMKKLDENVYVAIEKKEDGKLDNIRTKFSEPRLVERTGTGIMLIFRNVLETLSDPFFTIQDKANLEVEPEDYYFCARAQEKGFKIACDPRFETRHYGAMPFIHQP